MRKVVCVALLLLVGCATHPMKGKKYSLLQAQQQSTAASVRGWIAVVTGSLFVVAAFGAFYSARMYDRSDYPSSADSSRDMGTMVGICSLGLFAQAYDAFNAKKEWDDIEKSLSSAIERSRERHFSKLKGTDDDEMDIFTFNP